MFSSFLPLCSCRKILAWGWCLLSKPPPRSPSLMWTLGRERPTPLAGRLTAPWPRSPVSSWSSESSAASPRTRSTRWGQRGGLYVSCHVCSECRLRFFLFFFFFIKNVQTVISVICQRMTPIEKPLSQYVNFGHQISVQPNRLKCEEFTLLLHRFEFEKVFRCKTFFYSPL